MTAPDDSIDTGAGGSVLLRHITAQAARRAAERAAAGRPDPVVPPVPVPRGPDRVIASAIGRAADRVHGMPLFFDRVSVGHAVLAEVPELLPEQALILAVEGPGGAMGTAAICPGLLSSLIEMQAMGRISARPAPARRPTRTDGVISADFLNGCLAEIAADLAAHEGFEGMAGYRYASFVEDPRLLDLMLEDVTYRHIAVSLRAGPAGQRDGRLVLLLPGAAAAPRRVSLPLAEPETPAVAAAPDQGVLADAVRTLPIELVGVLCRRSISLGELRALTAGDTITLPPDALTSATLETATGQPLFRGKLGEVAGRHALRLAGSQGGGLRDRAVSARGMHDLAEPVSEHLTASDAGPGQIDGAAVDLAGMAPLAWGADESEAPGPLTALDPLPATGFDPPIGDLNVPDPFRDASQPLADDGQEFAFPATDLSAWEDAEGEAVTPLQINIG